MHLPRTRLHKGKGGSRPFSCTPCQALSAAVSGFAGNTSDEPFFLVMAYISLLRKLVHCAPPSARRRDVHDRSHKQQADEHACPHRRTAAGSGTTWNPARPSTISATSS